MSLTRTPGVPLFIPDDFRRGDARVIDQILVLVNSCDFADECQDGVRVPGQVRRLQVDVAGGTPDVTGGLDAQT